MLKGDKRRLASQIRSELLRVFCLIFRLYSYFTVFILMGSYKRVEGTRQIRGSGIETETHPRDLQMPPQRGDKTAYRHGARCRTVRVCGTGIKLLLIVDSIPYWPLYVVKGASHRQGPVHWRPTEKDVVQECESWRQRKACLQLLSFLLYTSIPYFWHIVSSRCISRGMVDYGR